MRLVTNWFYLSIVFAELTIQVSTAQCVIPTIQLTQRGSTIAAYSSFCQGEQVQLNAVSTQQNVRYQWKRNGNNVAGATGSTYVTGQQGLYTVTINSDECPDGATSTPVTITPEDCTPSGRVRIRGGSIEEDVDVALVQGRAIKIRLNFWTYPTERLRFPLTVTAYVYRKRDNFLIRTLTLQRNSQIEGVSPRPTACFVSTDPLQGIYYFSLEMRYDPTTYNDPDGYYITTAPVCCRETADNLPGAQPMVHYLEFAPHARYNLSQNNSGITPEFYVPNRLETCAGRGLSISSQVQLNTNINSARYSFADVLVEQNTAPRHRSLPMQPGYSPDNFTNNTANGLTINPETGLITGTPEKIGQYNYVVRAEFFQNGERMGEIRRELQLLVKDCDNLQPTVFASTVGNPSQRVASRICEGGQLQLNAVGVSAGGNLQWQRNGEPIAGATSTTLTVQEVGTYTLTVIKEEACPALVISRGISVSVTSPTVSLSIVGGGTCPGDPIQLAATTSTDAPAYSWYLNETVVPQQTGATLAATVNGTYRVQLTDVMDCTATSASIPVSNTSVSPTVTLLSEQQSGAIFCTGVNRFLRADASVSVRQYEWFRDNVALTGVTSATMLPTQTGSYTVRITSVNGCTAVSAPLILTDPDKPPVVTLTGSTSVICPGGSATLSVSNDNRMTYAWQRNGQLITGATSESYVATQAGEYRVLLQDPAGCTALSTTFTLKSNVPPDVTITGSREVCRDAETPLVATSSGSLLTYQWLLDGTAVSSATSATLLAQTGGTYQVQVTDPEGCTALSGNWSIQIIDQITVTLLPMDSVCVDAPAIVLQGTPSGGAFSGPGVTGNLFNPAQSGSGHFTITYNVVGPTTCQSGSASQQVTVRALPVVELGPDLQVNKGTTVELAGPVGATYQYLWEPPIGLSDPTVRNPVASPEQTTTYRLRVRDELGCEASDSIRLVVEPRLYIPDAFTPNGDGQNDFWELFGVSGFPGIDVTIFNRWGNVVFHSLGYQQPFAGVDPSGQSLPGGAYTYLIRHESTQTWRGTVLILR